MITKFLFWLVLISINSNVIDFRDASKCFNKAEIKEIIKEEEILITLSYQERSFEIKKNYFNLDEYKEMIYYRESYPIGYSAIGYSGQDFGKYQFRDCNIAIPIGEFLKDTLYQEHLMDSYTWESCSILRENNLDVNHYNLLVMHCVGQYGGLQEIIKQNKSIK